MTLFRALYLRGTMRCHITFAAPSAAEAAAFANRYEERIGVEILTLREVRSILRLA